MFWLFKYVFENFLIIEYTDRHFRYLARLLSKNVKLYTEMVVDQTILNQQHNLEQHLGFNQVEKPLGMSHIVLFPI